MSYHVIIIRANGIIELTIQPKAPTYNEWKAAVGGYVETVPYFTNMSYAGFEYKRGTAYANEEGRNMGLPLNARAMACWKASCPGGDPGRMTLCGDVIFFAKVKD